MAILEVIQNEGGSQLLAWKYPGRELTAWTQLIVREGEEAVLVTGGEPPRRYTAGRYTLHTANLPLLGSLIKLPFGGKTPFPAELWFVHTQAPLDVKWGTDVPIHPLGDGCEAVPPLRGYGLFSVQVEDAVLFLQTLSGRVGSFENKVLGAYLRQQLSQVVRTTIEACYRQIGPGFFGQEGISKQLGEQLQLHVGPVLAQYGLRLSHLMVSDLCARQPDGVERHLTCSILSVVLPPSAAPQRCAEPSFSPERRRIFLVALTFLLLFLLLVVFVLLLPPRQTADFVGIVLVTLAHFLTAGTLLWLCSQPQCLLVTLGFTVTSGLYWLGTVVIALFFRVFSVPDTGWLVALELGLAALAAIVLLGFWQSTDDDITTTQEVQRTDEAADT